MAWSDAARAAALEARRLHSIAKMRVGTTTSIVGTKIIGARKQIAKDIRAIRSGKSSFSGKSKLSVMEMARYSTNTRNAILKYGPFYKPTTLAGHMKPLTKKPMHWPKKRNIPKGK